MGTVVFVLVVLVLFATLGRSAIPGPDRVPLRELAPVDLARLVVRGFVVLDRLGQRRALLEGALRRR